MIWLFDLQDCDCVVVYYILDIALYSHLIFWRKNIVFKCFCSKWRRVKRPKTSWHNNLKYNIVLLITDSQTRDFLLDQIYQIMWQIQTIYWFRFITVTLYKIISFSVTKTTILIVNNTCTYHSLTDLFNLFFQMLRTPWIYSQQSSWWCIIQISFNNAKIFLTLLNYVDDTETCWLINHFLERNLFLEKLRTGN